MNKAVLEIFKNNIRLIRKRAQRRMQLYSQSKRRAGIIVILFCIFLPIDYLSCSLENKKITETEKEDEHARYQLGTTHPVYTPEFIAQCEERYYKRPEIPFVLGLLQIKEGMVVGDIGCGVGSYAFPIAIQAGKTGKVYAVDVQEKMIKVVKRYMRDNSRNPYQNIIVYVNKYDDTLIPRHALDIAWVSMVHFHNFPVLYKENVAMIKSIYDSLKPSGKLVIAEEADENGYTPNPAPYIIRHYQEAGFIFVRGPLQDPIIKTSFYLIFNKPDRDK